MVERGRDDAKAKDYKRVFAAIVPLVREEWPSIERAEIDATHGDFDALTELVAAKIDRTKVVVRRQLLELYDVATSAASSSASGLNGAANGAAKTAEPARAEVQVDEVISAVKRLEAFAADEAKRMSGKMLPVAEAKVRQNLWTSLLMALGLGLIVGLWLNGGRRSR